jgi:hypothetical protein
MAISIINIWKKKFQCYELNIFKIIVIFKIMPISVLAIFDGKRKFPPMMQAKIKLSTASSCLLWWLSNSFVIYFITYYSHTCMCLYPGDWGWHKNGIGHCYPFCHCLISFLSPISLVVTDIASCPASLIIVATIGAMIIF